MEGKYGFERCGEEAEGVACVTGFQEIFRARDGLEKLDGHGIIVSRNDMGILRWDLV